MKSSGDICRASVCAVCFNQFHSVGCFRELETKMDVVAKCGMHEIVHHCLRSVGKLVIGHYILKVNDLSYKNIICYVTLQHVK